jgi:hypothetical protein
MQLSTPVQHCPHVQTPQQVKRSALVSHHIIRLAKYLLRINACSATAIARACTLRCVRKRARSLLRRCKEGAFHQAARCNPNCGSESQIRRLHVRRRASAAAAAAAAAAKVAHLEHQRFASFDLDPCAAAAAASSPKYRPQPAERRSHVTSHTSQIKHVQLHK